jgi:hypothetical protein
MQATAKHIAEINIKKISFHIFMIFIFFGAGFECRLLFLLMFVHIQQMDHIVVNSSRPFFTKKIIFRVRKRREVKLDNIC